MSKINYFLYLLILSFSAVSSFAQTENKDVFITASGSGKTLEDAKQAALRNTIEQAFGAFISSKTEMFNDKVVADQMASVSSGNIKSFEILNQDQLPDSNWGVTLKAVVSVDKLTSFVEAKGITIEIKGGMFALNIKQQILNEQGELNAIAEMVGLLHEPMQTSFDYVIKSSEPTSLDDENKNWEIPIVVTATSNKNFDFCTNYFIKTLKALSLTKSEVETYMTLNKKVYAVTIEFKENFDTIFLRKQNSVRYIENLFSNAEFYTRLFEVKSGMSESIGKGKIDLQNFQMEPYRYLKLNKNRDDSKSWTKSLPVSFPTSGSTVATFKWKEKLTLSQIEQLTGYTVKPRGIVSAYKNGGYVVYEKDGHGFVASLCDIYVDHNWSWTEAKNTCDEFVINSYNDWFLPSKDELLLIYTNLFKLGIGRLLESTYISSTDGINPEEVCIVLFYEDGNTRIVNKGSTSMYDNVRPIRKF